MSDLTTRRGRARLVLLLAAAAVPLYAAGIWTFLT